MHTFKKVLYLLPVALFGEPIALSQFRRALAAGQCHHPLTGLLLARKTYRAAWIQSATLQSLTLSLAQPTSATSSSPFDFYRPSSFCPSQPSSTPFASSAVLVPAGLHHNALCWTSTAASQDSQISLGCAGGCEILPPSHRRGTIQGRRGSSGLRACRGRQLLECFLISTWDLLMLSAASYGKGRAPQRSRSSSSPRDSSASTCTAARICTSRHTNRLPLLVR